MYKYTTEKILAYNTFPLRGSLKTSNWRRDERESKRCLGIYSKDMLGTVSDHFMLKVTKFYLFI